LAERFVTLPGKAVIRARYWGANIPSRGGHDLDTFKR
jgi:hypothetical protein